MGVGVTTNGVELPHEVRGEGEPLLWLHASSGAGRTLTIAGVAAGTAAALASTRVLASLLYGVEPIDPLTFAAAASFLMLAALLACCLPARQAARLDAIAVLRQ